MGTNYYLYEQADCPSCGRGYKPLHIGKSSAGWCFSLHIIPELNIGTLFDWRNRWEAPGAIIKNEYDEVISKEKMIEIITERQGGLKRHPIDRYCVGHGEGTYDFIAGDFS